MSEFKHTPGPWDYQPGTKGGHWNVGLKNEFHECIGLRGDEYMCFHGMGTEHDARLIAAAPTLLTKLIEAANYIDHLGGDSKQYRAAIAKATGE